VKAVVKYSVITFGCRVNQADSLGLEEELLARGASAAPTDEADVVFVNTCSVTASADQAARQAGECEEKAEIGCGEDLPPVFLHVVR